MKKTIIITAIFLATMASPCAYANAQAAPIAVPTAVVLNVSPTEIKNTFSQTMGNLKSFVLDKLAYVAAKQVLHQMTVSVVNWINSGFKGQPSFLTNPEGFFLDAADQVTGAFIAANGPLKNLCSPWSVDIRLNLAIDQLNSGISSARYTCTLDTLIKNAKYAGVTGGVSINGFLKGDFRQGGWPAFISLTTEDQNNPNGSYLRAYSDNLYAIGQRKASISADLQLGNGFLSWEDCTDLPDDAYNVGDTIGSGNGSSIVRAGPDGTPQQCTTKTPGSVIANSLHDQLASPVVELELANDINSVINALVSQLVTQTLQKGLLALSSGGSSTNGSGKAYLTQVYNDATMAKTVGVTTANPDYTTLSSLKSKYDSAVALVSNSQDRYVAARSCFINKTGTGATPNQIGIGNANIQLIDQALNTKVIPLINQLNTADASIQTMMDTLSGSTQSTVTVPGTSNVDALAQVTQTQTSNYLNNFPNYNSTIDTQSISNTANTDYNTAQTQSSAFNQEAAAFQSTCSSM